MNKYKIIILSLLGLVFTSCKDFLDKPSEDTLTLKDYCKTEAELNSLTAALNGGLTWSGYSDKFAWCAHELMSGNVYHEFGDEGQFFFLTFTSENAIMANGYQSLSGVIARANNLISDIPEQAKENGLSDEVIKRAIAEMKMYRGMAYFLMTELWGEVPIVLDNAKVIRENLSEQIPKATRESIYKLIEQDWLYAAEHLPTNSWGEEGWRVTQLGAKGMLAKLYLTMASCQNDYALYRCPDPRGYYEKAKTYANEVLAMGASLESEYKNIFTIRGNSKESLFALQFFDGPYGVGSSRQIQFGRSKIWNGNLDVYGGGKGLTVTLFNSFGLRDVRKKETSLYNDGTDNPKYTLYDGREYIYYINPNAQFTIEPPYGAEDVSYTLNAIKKYVYGYVPKGDKFSCPMTIDFLRTADVMLILAEAEMYLAGATDVASPTSSPAALNPLNEVRRRAGLDPVNSIAMCIPEIPDEQYVEYTDNGGNLLTATYMQYLPTYDLMLERRWEFALECQSWLDLKRLYYRNERAAVNFIEEQDRAWAYKPKLELGHPAIIMADYQRQREMALLTQSYPEADRQIDEKKVYYENLKWFLPLPKNVDTPALQQAAQNFVDQLTEIDEYGRYVNYPY